MLLVVVPPPPPLQLLLVLRGTSRQGLSLPTVVRCYGDKDKLGRTILCLVRIGMSSPLGPYRPGLDGRQSSCYSH
jgi:hypothetical protein